MGRMAVLAVAATAATAGCGGGESADELGRAADATLAAGTASVRYQLRIDGLPGGAVLVGGAGVLDGRQRTSRLSVDLSDLAPDSAGSSGAVPALQGQMMTDRLRVLVELPLFRASVEEHTWVSFDLAELERADIAAFPPFLHLSRNNPILALLLLHGATGDVDEVGKEELEGVPTTHYAATIDLERLPGDAPEDLREPLAAAAERMIEQAETTTIDVDVYVDDEGRVRSISEDYPLRAAPGTAGETSVRITFDLSNFGADLNVQLPPEAETLSLDEFEEVIVGR